MWIFNRWRKQYSLLFLLYNIISALLRHWALTYDVTAQTRDVRVTVTICYWCNGHITFVLIKEIKLYYSFKGKPDRVTKFTFLHNGRKRTKKKRAFYETEVTENDWKWLWLVRIKIYSNVAVYAVYCLDCTQRDLSCNKLQNKLKCQITVISYMAAFCGAIRSWSFVGKFLF